MNLTNLTNTERLEEIHKTSVELDKTLKLLVAQGKTMKLEESTLLLKACRADALWIKENIRRVMANDPACRKPPVTTKIARPNFDATP